jgi:hypothetical protein
LFSVLVEAQVLNCFLQVEEVELPYDKAKNQRRFFCFVSFDAGEAVDAVCADADKHVLGGKNVSLVAILLPTAIDFLNFISNGKLLDSDIRILSVHLFLALLLHGGLSFLILMC